MKYWLIVLIIIIGVLGYLFWKNNSDPTIQAMRADSYGGTTQDETFNLFVNALEKEDVDLAAKYFVLDDNLSRDKWIKTFNELKDKEFLDEMVKDLDKNQMEFKLNDYSGVWKIQNL